jgi:hypothetical protein
MPTGIATIAQIAQTQIEPMSGAMIPACAGLREANDVKKDHESAPVPSIAIVISSAERTRTAIVVAPRQAAHINRLERIRFA